MINALLGPGVKSKTMIDLCCCNARMTRQMPFKEKTYVDALDCWDIPGEMDRFVQADVLGDDPVLQRQYDVAICSDGIEHLKKPEGHRLIERMRSISQKQVLFTPLGDYLVDENDPDPKGHKSGWFPEDVPEFASIVFPVYHPTLNIGAFFFWRSDNMKEEMNRVRTCLGKHFQLT